MPIRLLAAAIVLMTSSQIAAAETSWVPLSIDESGAVVVPVGLNGRGPFLFLLDTGSSHSVMSRSLVDHLRLKPVASTTVLTSTGRDERLVVKLDLTVIGSKRSEDLLASVVSSAQLTAIAYGVDGIIGQDFLFGFHYTLDYRRRRLDVERRRLSQQRNASAADCTGGPLSGASISWERASCAAGS